MEERQCKTENCQNKTKKKSHEYCPKCYKKQQEQQRQRGIDLEKEITVPLWVLIVIAALGFAVGAWVW